MHRIREIEEAMRSDKISRDKGIRAIEETNVPWKRPLVRATKPPTPQAIGSPAKRFPSVTSTPCRCASGGCRTIPRSRIGVTEGLRFGW